MEHQEPNDAAYQPTTQSTKRYVYHGLSLLEERDSDNTTVLRRFYAGGHVDVANGGTRYAYTTDHLGSIREVMELDGASSNPTTATLAARYDYDLWGKRSVLDGGTPAETLVMHGYTGHVRHQWSGLWLAPYRAYNSGLGRWISRDPIAEDGGINLYGYVLNAPVHFIDPLGLDPWDYVPDPVRTGLASPRVRSAADAMAGAADVLSLGLGRWLRDKAGKNGWIDPCAINENSPAYGFGAAAAAAYGAARAAFTAANGLNDSSQHVPPAGNPTPPGYDPETWDYGPGNTQTGNQSGPRYYSPDGDIYRYHGDDKWHNPHWDHWPPSHPSYPHDRVPIPPLPIFK